MASKVDEAAEFATVMGMEFPTVPHLAREVSELIRFARRHRKLQEKACNEQVPEGHDEKCEASIRAVCGRIGCAVIFGGDPRGFTVKILLPSGRSNHWGGETWGVPQ